MVLFVHESAMGVDCRDETNSMNGELPTAAIAPYIDALSSCIHSIHQTLDTIANVDVERFTNLPTLAVARTTYPVVSLIKIYSLLTAPDSRIGQVVDQESLKVEYYLDKVINHYRSAAVLDAGRVAAKFGNILMMLRNWFIKKKENGPELREIFGAETKSDTPSDRGVSLQLQTQHSILTQSKLTSHKNKTGNTSLNALSELAMGDPSRSASASSPPQTRVSKGNIYSPSTLSQEMPNNPTPGPGTPHGGSIMSNRSDPSPAPANTTWSTASFTPPIPGSHDPTLVGDRAMYQSFPHTDPSQVYATQSQIQHQNPYTEMSSMGMPMDQPMGMVPELQMEGAFDTENLFALGNIMDEGLFSFPFSFEGNFQL